MRQAHDEDRTGRFRAKAEPGSPEYQTKVAQPVMAAVDGMAPEWRALVHEFGYVETYQLWKRRSMVTVDEARRQLIVQQTAAQARA